MSFSASHKRPKYALPDYGALWKQYKGEFDNINKRTEGGIADIRARFAATGASSDILDAEANRLRESGNLEIAALRNSTTYAALEEGFGIATQKVGNPYSGAPAGMEDFATRQRQRDPTAEEKAAFHSTDRNAQPAQYFESYRLNEPPVTMDDYYNKYYPAADAAVSETPEEKARRGASGYGGASGGAAPSPLFPAFSNFNDIWG